MGGGISIEPAAKTSSLPPKAYTRLMIFAMPGRSLTYVGQGGQQAQPAEDASGMQVSPYAARQTPVARVPDP